jgi:hypothetical protein
MVNAMSYLSKNINEKRDAGITRCLEHIHIGFQCKDDIDDFIADLENNQHTYAHVLVIQHINGNSKNYTKSNTYLHRYFYVSGLSEYLIQKSIKHFSEAKKIADNYQLFDLRNFINDEISTAKAQIGEINMLIDKTRVKARLSNKNKIVKENDQEALEESICYALNFLNTNLENNMTLSDFMTSAGIGKQWISNYCAFMLVGHELTNDIVQKLSTSLRSNDQKGASFNEKIVHDADSLTFQIGTSKKIFNEVNNDQINMLKKFQHKNGGWCTYIDETTLRNYDNDKYAHQVELGIKFLLNNQKTDGSWKSGRILTIPQTDIIDNEQIQKWRKSSFGVNIIVDDHKRIFTTVTVLKTLISLLNTQ